MYFPSEEDFLKLTEKGNLIPVYREILADLETPVSAYYKISETAKHSFLLESVEGEEKIARFSFLARDPELVFQAKGNSANITTFKEGKAKKIELEIKDTPMPIIRQLLQPYRFVNVDGLPRFCGGMVGYFNYDVVRYFERLPKPPIDDLKIPDILLVLVKELIIFDHVNHKMKVVHCVEIDEKSPKSQKVAAYHEALKSIDRLIEDIERPLAVKKSTPAGKSAKINIKSNLTQEEFEKIVEQAKEDIKAGEIIQVVLSQRFSLNLSVDPLLVYRMLRGVNPSPYMYYLNFGDIKIVGSSPELLVRCENGVVETRPIAGTRPRGANDRQDGELALDLLNDPKERAEHVMLVDLGRNDLGRVCQQGTVKVSEFMKIEKYSHVMHIVSNVKGKLKEDQDSFDVLQAAFPAGTVSGAPKIRAMEIIDRLENVARGPYAGAIGYFSFSGNLDSCITIRTIVVNKGKAYIQAGAGIVADSDPAKEYQETMNKAKAQIKAIELAIQQKV